MSNTQGDSISRTQAPEERLDESPRPAGSGHTVRRRQDGAAQPQASRAGTPQPRRAAATTRRAPSRAAGVEPARRGPNRNQPRPQRLPEDDYDYDPDRDFELEEDYDEGGMGSGPSVPLIPALLVFVVSILATVFITRAIVLRSSGAAATTEAAASSTESTNAQSTTASDSKGSTTTNDGSATDAASTDTSNDATSNSGVFKAVPGEGVKSPWTATGTFNSGDATLDEEVKAFCDGIATTSMDQDTAALEVYKGVAWSDYVERDDAQNPAGPDWRIEYARKYYEHDCSGNCYEFAAFLSYCLQYLGFSDAHAEGVIIQLQSGDWGEHGLVFVTNTDGSSCLCDTSKGTDGWMLKDTAYNYELQDFENAAVSSSTDSGLTTDYTGTTTTSDGTGTTTTSDGTSTGYGTTDGTGTTGYDTTGTTTSDTTGTTGYDSTGYGTTDYGTGTTGTTTYDSTGYGTDTTGTGTTGTTTGTTTTY